MKRIKEYIGEFKSPFIISNAVGIALLLGSYFFPAVFRWIFVAIFFIAGWVNLIIANRTPHLYIEGFGPHALLSCYKSFIYGFFSRHTKLAVSLIAVGQIVVSLLLSSGNILFHTGICGGILFLVAISPLGIASAFPATLFMAIALALLSIH